MLDQFSATIQKIYGAADNPARWQDAFAAVDELTDCAGVVVNLVAKNEPALTTTITSPRIANHFNATEVAEYERELLPICPRIRAGEFYRNAPYVCDYMILSKTEMLRDPVYTWYNEHGLGYFIGSSLGETDKYQVMWSLQRRPSQGHAQAHDLRIFELLKPHVSQALALADQIGTLRSFDRFSSAVLEALPHALFALDGQGALLFVNHAADILLKCGDGLTCVANKLQTRVSAERSQLDGLIREAAILDIAGAGGWMRISRSNGGPPYAAFIAPLNCGDQELLAAQAKVLVIVHDTADRRGADPRMLMEVYELTNAEARLANALCVGHSIESTAALFGVQPATIRSQLKSIFRKTRVSRQQDLVRLLTSLSPTGV